MQENIVDNFKLNDVGPTSVVHPPLYQSAVLFYFAFITPHLDSSGRNNPNNSVITRIAFILLHVRGLELELEIGHTWKENEGVCT